MRSFLDKREFLKPGLFESTELATDKIYFAHSPNEQSGITKFIKFKVVTPTAIEILAEDGLHNITHAALFPHIHQSGKHTGLEYRIDTHPEHGPVVVIGEKSYKLLNPQDPLKEYPKFKGLKNKIWVDLEHEFKDFIREEK